MRVPSFERYAKISQATAILVTGAIIGAMIYHSIFQMNFNALRTTIVELEDKLNQYENDIRKLNQFKHQHTVIKSILPVPEEDLAQGNSSSRLDELTKSELKKRIRAELAVLVGRSIYDIDSDAKLARLLLSRKEYKAVEKDYFIEIKTMLVVDNVLHVWFTARRVEPQPG